MTQEPLYPKGHPKIIVQDSQRVNTDACSPSKKKKKKKNDTLQQDAANATLQSETLRRNCVRCNNRKRWCKKRQKGAKRLRWRMHQTRFRF